jgi:Beta-lactamase enzyme family
MLLDITLDVKRRFYIMGLVVLVAVGVAVPEAGWAASGDLGPFIDDDGHPGEPYLAWLAELGAVQGCNPPRNDRICPDRVLNRVEAAKILVRVGVRVGTIPPPGSAPDQFVDAEGIWGGAAERLANHLAALGVIDGCDPPANRHFCPLALLRRGHVAKIVVRALDLDAPPEYRSPWDDTSKRFYEGVARIAAYRRMWDASAGRFAGETPVTRAEFARVLAAALDIRICPTDPFHAARVASLASRFPQQSFTAYVFDTRSGCAYWMSPEQRLRTASVFKVMVMAGTLLEGQERGRGPTGWEMGQMTPMITESANDPVRSLWRSFGGSPWYRRQTRIFGLSDTVAVGDRESGWGRSTTSAKDQGDLIRQVLLGDWGPLDPTHRAVARDLMTSVVPSQTWGITSGVPSGWIVAQKNGFAGGVANSAGFVEDPGGGGYVIVVMTNGWPTWSRGVPVVEEIAGWVASVLAG